MSSIRLRLLLNFYVKRAMNKLDLVIALQKRQHPEDMAEYLSYEQQFHF